MVLRQIYVVIEVWDDAMAKAKRNGQSLSAVIRRMLELWLQGKINLDP